MTLNYSFIVPVYNRPQEIRELLESMDNLQFPGDFEVVIVEDGSGISSESVVEEFRERLQVSYYFKPNSGPGSSRNYGMERAKGNYFLILDSDVILPSDYLERVDEFLQKSYCDCFGGPDAAHESFSDVQKAIDYSMTSIFTTGGIRGKRSSGFQPRSFNMGISKEAFQATGGFGRIHPGEDPDLSLRLEKAGFTTCLIPNAKVYHKRRIDWHKFYIQVNKFGLVRPILNQWHPGSGKITYWFPAFFIAGLALAVLLCFFGLWVLLFCYIFYFVLTGLDAAIQHKNLYIGLLAIVATFIQFSGYGYGFIRSYWKTRVLARDPETQFPKLFFKG